MNHVNVSWTELLAGLKTLRIALQETPRPDGIFTYQDGFLHIRTGGSSIKIRADGFWQGQARLESTIMVKLEMMLPYSDLIPIKQVDDSIIIGSMKFKCIWEETPTCSIVIPIGVDIIYLLGLGQRYTIDEIRKSGLWPKYEAALREKNARVQIAYDNLSDLGVSRFELEALVLKSIRRENLENFDDE